MTEVVLDNGGVLFAKETFDEVTEKVNQVLECDCDLFTLHHADSGRRVVVSLDHIVLFKE